ncbi:MAG TPA: RNA-binding protein [Chitinophagaceae bacterium]
MTIRITNLDRNLIESDLQRLFTPYGEIHTVRIDRDHLNNRSHGRAFIDMPVQKEAQQAILNLNGVLLGGKHIEVSSVAYSSEKRNFYS